MGTRALVAGLVFALGCGAAVEQSADVSPTAAPESADAVAMEVMAEHVSGWPQERTALLTLAESADPFRLARAVSALHGGTHAAKASAIEAAFRERLRAEMPPRDAAFMAYIAEFARARGAYPAAQEALALAFARFAATLSTQHPQEAEIMRRLALAAAVPMAYPSPVSELGSRRPPLQRRHLRAEGIRPPFTLEMAVAGAVLATLSQAARQPVPELTPFLRRAGVLSIKDFGPTSHKKRLDHRRGSGAAGGAQSGCAVADARGGPWWWLALWWVTGLMRPRRRHR